MRHPAKRAEAGFALPSVLVLTGVVSIIFLTAIMALDTLGRQARDVVDGERFRAQALSLEARIGYLAATGQLGPTTLAPLAAASQDGPAPAISLDGSVYRDRGSQLLVSVQDEAGLIDLDGLSHPQMLRLFASLGLDGASQSMMADRLADFVDPDDLKREQGAEAGDYARAGMGAPPNAPLRRKAQLFGVLGWRDLVKPAAWRAMADFVTADPTSSSVNVNTAPAITLEVLYGLTPAQAASAIAVRNQQPFTTLDAFGQAAGLALVGDAERVYTFPNGRLALRIIDPRARQAARVRLVLTPADQDRPLWIEEESQSIWPTASPMPSNDVPALPDPTS